MNIIRTLVNAVICYREYETRREKYYIIDLIRIKSVYKDALKEYKRSFNN